MEDDFQTSLAANDDDQELSCYDPYEDMFLEPII